MDTWAGPRNHAQICFRHDQNLQLAAAGGRGPCRRKVLPERPHAVSTQQAEQW